MDFRPCRRISLFEGGSPMSDRIALAMDVVGEGGRTWVRLRPSQ